MKNSIYLFLVFSISISNAFAQKSKTKSVLKKSEIELKVVSLLSKMTIEEKIGQMTQITVTSFQSNGNIELNAAKLSEGIQKYHIGSILNVPNSNPQTIENWKKYLTTINTETS